MGCATKGGCSIMLCQSSLFHKRYVRQKYVKVIGFHIHHLCLSHTPRKHLPSSFFALSPSISIHKLVSISSSYPLKQPHSKVQRINQKRYNTSATAMIKYHPKAHNSEVSSEPDPSGPNSFPDLSECFPSKYARANVCKAMPCKPNK